MALLGPQILAFALFRIFEEHIVLGKQGKEQLLSLINDSNVGNGEKKIWHEGAYFPGCYFSTGKGCVNQPNLVEYNLSPFFWAEYEQSIYVRGSHENPGSCKRPNGKEKA